MTHVKWSKHINSEVCDAVFPLSCCVITISPLGKPRIGTLTLGRSLQSLNTPCFLVYTSHGAPPYTTLDNLRTINPKLTAVQLCLATLFDILITSASNYPISSFRKFFGLEGFLLFFTLSDPMLVLPEHFNTKKHIKINSVNGRTKISSRVYMKLVEELNPDVFCPLIDNIPLHCPKYKDKEAVNRTLMLLDDCILAMKDHPDLQSSALFGVIQGNSSIEGRRRSAYETSKRDVDGFLLENFGSHLKRDVFRTLLSTVVVIYHELSAEKPRMISTFGIPELVLDAVEFGIDIFDGTYVPCRLVILFLQLLLNLRYPLLMAEDGNALTFYIPGHSTISKAKHISLWDDIFLDDVNPLCPGCSCMACTDYSRSYVHHLLSTHEMLAKVLLTLHNLQLYENFFCAIRSSIKAERFSTFKETFEKFYL
ncbi:queuine tRNA-ribosyltransferase accessory subunit 2-like isoform X4 [Zophobas morio]|uniref:queuine tRNA-ribosyltransferase accessory subunit 2-like isoform X4 n=1 Tax=Zophobas morio TaxID=2755281 RepID=UPI003083DCEE